MLSFFVLWCYVCFVVGENVRITKQSVSTVLCVCIYQWCFFMQVRHKGIEGKGDSLRVGVDALMRADASLPNHNPIAISVAN